MQSSHRADIPRADAVGQESPGDGVASGYLAAAARFALGQRLRFSSVAARFKEESLAYCSSQDPSAHKGFRKTQAFMFYFPKLEREGVYCFLLPLPPPTATNPLSRTHTLLLL